LTVLKVIFLTFLFCSHLQLRKVTHEGCINRIRSMTQNPHICASWAESGYVQVSFLICGELWWKIHLFFELWKFMWYGSVSVPPLCVGLLYLILT
jgi:hypothetical protein